MEELGSPCVTLAAGSGRYAVSHFQIYAYMLRAGVLFVESCYV